VWLYKSFITHSQAKEEYSYIEIEKKRQEQFLQQMRYFWVWV
jgi:hypothetical protein